MSNVSAVRAPRITVPAENTGITGGLKIPNNRIPLSDAQIKSVSQQVISAGVEMNAKAPKKSDIAREVALPSKFPFSNSALLLKDGRVVLKTVVTGGFVPPTAANPFATYSKPFAVSTGNR
jgi:hypothetical protein